MTKRIYIDKGHGGRDPGAVGNGLYEKELTLYLGDRIEKTLKSVYKCEVKSSRDDDRTLSLDDRTDDANAWGADFLLSVHINAGGGTGYEDYIYSGLSNSSTTAKMRNTIHAEIVKVLDKYGIRNRGKKKANFHMLRESAMAAMLSENLFIDTDNDADLLKNKAFLNDIADAHAHGIAKALELPANPKPVPKDNDIGDGVFYRVVTGSFDNRENAEQRIAALKKAGFESFIDIYRKGTK